MSVYRDHTKTQLDLLKALNYFSPSQEMKMYRLILKAWNKVSIALLQRAFNVQTIVEGLVYNRTCTSKRLTKSTRVQFPILESCGHTLVQTLLPVHLRGTPNTPHRSTESPANIIVADSTQQPSLE